MAQQGKQLASDQQQMDAMRKSLILLKFIAKKFLVGILGISRRNNIAAIRSIFLNNPPSSRGRYFRFAEKERRKETMDSFTEA